MLANNNPYNTEIPGLEVMQSMAEDEITEQLQKYLGNRYKGQLAVRLTYLKYNALAVTRRLAATILF